MSPSTAATNTPTQTAPTKTGAASSAATAPARRGRPSTGARERILDAAIEVLKADGYAGLTIAKVAAAAGESKALVAYHYGSKQGLVQAAGRAIAEMITDEVLDAVDGADTVEAVIRGVDAGVERVLDDDERIARLYFDLAAVSVVDPEIRETITEVNEQWRVVLTRLLNEAGDGLPTGRARVLTVMVIAGLQGMTLERIERGATPERKRARELFVRAAVAAASTG
jgi:AcrR family transcriptional regulator